jgi:hypothetical protein
MLSRGDISEAHKKIQIALARFEGTCRRRTEQIQTRDMAALANLP